MIKRNLQRFYPYGLKSLTECISRAALLSQPADVPNFLSEYMSELLSFRDSCHEMDPKLLCFNFQELYENIFFTIWAQRNTNANEVETELRKALETLYSSLTCSNEGNVEQKSATPTSDLAVLRPSLANLKRKPSRRGKSPRESSIKTPHQGAGTAGKTAKIDRQPSPSRTSLTPSPLRTRPTEKIVPTPSRVMTGHGKHKTKKNVLPPIPQENRVGTNFATCKDRETEKTSNVSIIAKVTRQDSLRIMRKTLKRRKPERNRTKLPPIEEEEPEPNTSLMTSTCPSATEVTGLEETTKTQKKTECKDKTTKSTLAKVYKSKVQKPKKTNARLNKTKPEWTFEQPRSSRVRRSVKLGPGSDVPKQGLGCGYYHQLKSKAIFYIV